MAFSTLSTDLKLLLKNFKLFKVAAVGTLQDIPESVMYQNRDGQMETVTIRESSTGTLYVWPVYMN